MRKISDLHHKNIVVYDLEISNVIDGKNITWNDKDKMGISVGCLFDYLDGDMKVYLSENMHELATRLENADIITGFNINDFDHKLLEATLKIDGLARRLQSKSYDLLPEVRKSTGQVFPKGCKLDNVLEATFGMQKTQNGADAPLMHQRGEIAKLITYCVADVRRERMCFEEAYVSNYLKTPMHGMHQMRNPLDLLKVNQG